MASPWYRWSEGRLTAALEGAEALIASGGGGGFTHHDAIDVPHAQILTIPTVQVQIIAAPGPSLIAIPTSLTFDCDTTAATYTLNGGSNNIGLGVGLSRYFYMDPDFLLTLGTRFVVPVPPAADSGLDAITEGINQPVMLCQNGSNNTGGNAANFLVVIVEWVVYNAVTKTLVAA